MKYVLKLEAAGLFMFATALYFLMAAGSWTLYLALFFLPDMAFLFMFVSKKATVVAYNILHHQGLMAVVGLAGLFFHQDIVLRIGLIFLAHAAFDRVAGYGLKYADSLDHTHLRWVGKSKQLHQSVD